MRPHLIPPANAAARSVARLSEIAWCFGTVVSLNTWAESGLPLVLIQITARTRSAGNSAAVNGDLRARRLGSQFSTTMTLGARRVLAVEMALRKAASKFPAARVRRVAEASASAPASDSRLLM